jgi:hypothetical protein
MTSGPQFVTARFVLLVPRELEVQHGGGVKSLSDEQIERGIELIKGMLAEREAAANAKVIDAVPEPEPTR